MAFLGGVVFTAQNSRGEDNDFTSAEALADPHHPELTLDTALVHLNVFSGTLLETHFAELDERETRDRMGRSLAFLANMVLSGTGSRILAADSGAAILIAGDGESCEVFAQASAPNKPRYPVYLITISPDTYIDPEGQPLHISGVLIRRLNPGKYGRVQDLWDMTNDIPGAFDYRLSYDGAAFSSPATSTDDQDEVKYGPSR